MKWKSKLKFATIFVFAAAIAFASSANAANNGVKFATVSGSSTKDGSSWANAMGQTELVAYLTAHNPADTVHIYVASGDYSPGAGGTDTFNLKAGVKLYGGYDPASTGTNTASHDIVKFVTKLNGGGTARDVAVVTGGTGATITDTRLDGFTITGGNNTTNNGGGMNNEGPSPLITNCTFVGNTATNGGGMCNDLSSSVVMNCTFSGNTATDGGGMINTNNSTVIIINCTFSNNAVTGGAGGGLNNDNCVLTVANTIFWGNTATGGGNEIRQNGAVGNTLTNCVVNNTPGAILMAGAEITSSDMVWTNPSLGAFTGVYYPLLAGSSAVGKGLAVSTLVKTTYVPDADQLGKARPASPALVTIGSIEGAGAPPVPVTGITLNKPTTTIVAGNTEKLTATVNPVAGVDQSVTWSSNAPTIATVGATTGVVTAVAAGTATIKATASADASKSATCVVTVTGGGVDSSGCNAAVPGTTALSIGALFALLPLMMVRKKK